MFDIENIEQKFKDVVSSSEWTEFQEKFNNCDDIYVIGHGGNLAIADHTAVDYLLQTITNCRVLAVTAAPPEVGGHHHVNCQPIEYWIELIQQYGMCFDKEQTMVMKQVATTPAGSDSHFQRNGMIFHRV
tara:strand:- start:278 stop:667 length:390 start_codon:yes stop_codon:yes gene_type:complete